MELVLNCVRAKWTKYLLCIDFLVRGNFYHKFMIWTSEFCHVFSNVGTLEHPVQQKSFEKKWCLAGIFYTEDLDGFENFPRRPTGIPRCNMVSSASTSQNSVIILIIFLGNSSPHELLGGSKSSPSNDVRKRYLVWPPRWEIVLPR